MYLDLVGVEVPKQKLVAQARGFNVQFTGAWLYKQDLDFRWRGSRRLAIKGPNGCGKSTLLKAILGDELVTRGEFRVGELHKFCLDQRATNLTDSKSVLENVRDVASLDESQIRNSLARFLFTGDSVFQRVGTLSGGERMRAALAKGLLSQDKPELMILDEPTNNLDLANIKFLEGFVREFKGAVIVVSHDETFLRNCSVTEELVLDG